MDTDAMVRFLAALRWIALHAKVILWVLIMFLGLVFLGWLLLFRNKEKPIQPEKVVDSFSKLARDRIEDAQASAKVEAELAKQYADEDRRELEQIKKEPDPAIRRRKLAEYLDRNL